MRRRWLLAPLLALLASCSAQPADFGVTADCDEGSGNVNPLLVLMAQSVPTAEMVPCIGAMPSAWQRGEIDVRRGRASFAFVPSSAEGPDDALLSVVLTESCDVSGATEVPSDQPGATRYERLRDVDQGYQGERYYVYDGGCTTLVFELPGQGRAEQVGQASLAVDLIPRQALRDGVRDRSDGRLQLDDEAPAA
jgi:hypothetical protein